MIDSNKTTGKKGNSTPCTNKIVEILVNRDGMDAQEAMTLVMETRQEILDLVARGGSLDEAEEILACNLGLEPDYIDCLWSY